MKVTYKLEGYIDSEGSDKRIIEAELELLSAKNNLELQIEVEY